MRRGAPNRKGTIDLFFRLHKDVLGPVQVARNNFRVGQVQFVDITHFDAEILQ